VLAWAANRVSPLLSEWPGVQPRLLSEQAARLGQDCIGDEMGRRWVAVALRRDAHLLEAARPLISRRQGRSETFEDAAQLLAWCRMAREKEGVRCVLLLGTSIPWWVQETLQLEGICWVGRLPLNEPEQIAAYSRHIAEAERSKRNVLRREAWIIAPRNDGFTQILHELLSRTIQTILREEGFTLRLMPADDGALPEVESRPGLILFLTHGDAQASSGSPVIAPEVLERVYRACAGGAMVAHFGCNGAGGFPESRYADLPPQLSGYAFNFPSNASDVFSTFSQRCLLAGASSVLAHVDITWSSAFESNSPIDLWLSSVATGSGASGFAMSDIPAAAVRSARRASACLMNGDAREAGWHWLRYLDLSGFVVLGDPSFRFRWEET
jgi:hypothetical protein